jgi:uncharacterized NAD(P)/FAD-binding protein YdhS
MYRVVIVGGGFAGAACAIHVLRDHPRLAAELTIVEPRPVLGAGLAYSTPAREHRTNVAAARMSVFPEQPTHFHDWLRAQNTAAGDSESEMPDGRLYPSRAVFGRYVAAMLHAEIEAHQAVTVRHVHEMAAAVAPDGSGFRVSLAEGGVVPADALVLAVSHTAPDLPGALRGLDTVIADPWNVGALVGIRKDARVLIVGTGLTACDVVASLLAQGHRGHITMVSRHGMLPRRRTPLPVEAEGDFATRPETTALGLLRRIRRAVSVAQEAGRPWENIVDALRQQAVIAWGRLDWTERRRLLRHLRVFWDVHRFQSAPQIDAALGTARRAGALDVRAASLAGAENTAEGTRVTLRPRGASESEILVVDTVINCTGPGHRSVVETHPVLAGLAEAGALQADPAALGILVDDQARVVRADGTAWPNLFVAGPLARGTFGELMGLPQVNTQPRAVASCLARLAAA